MPRGYQAVLLFGPPGCGKGTQGKALDALPAFFHCSTGDIFRGLDPDSEHGTLFRQYATKGLLVPDDVTVAMWADFMRRQVADHKFDPAAELVLLDGVPRSVEQARMLDEHIEPLKIIDFVCSDEKQLVERIRNRALSSGRADDSDVSTIRRRLEVYHEQTAPLLDHYPSDIVAAVDCLPPAGEVLQTVLNVLIPLSQTAARQ